MAASEELAKIDREIAGLARHPQDATQDSQDMAETKRALEDEARISRASAESSRTAIQRHETASRNAEDLTSELRTQELGTASQYWALANYAQDLENTLDSQREMVARTTTELSSAQDHANQVWSEWIEQEDQRVADEAQASMMTERAVESTTMMQSA